MSFQTECKITAHASTASANHSTEHLQPILPATMDHFLALIDWTGQQIKKGKCGYIPDDLAPILSRLGVDEKEWVRTVMEFNKRFRSFSHGGLCAWKIGTVVGRHWIQGRKTAAKLYVQPP